MNITAPSAASLWPLLFSDSFICISGRRLDSIIKQFKALLFSAVLLGLIVLHADIAFGRTAADGNHSVQQIYSVFEVDSPYLEHIALNVRTGLSTGAVWIRRADGGYDFGVQLSYGESQRVWQISHKPERTGSHTLIINANHAHVMDEGIVSRIFLSGYHGGLATALVTDANDMHVRPDAISNTEQNVVVNGIHYWHGIGIIGDEHFVQRTIRALEAVEGGPRWAYDYVLAYLDYVKQHSVPRNANAGGHVNVRTRTFYVYNNTYSSHVMWFASALVHEAVHVRQYREYRESQGNRASRSSTFGRTAANRMRIEMEALDIQIRFLEEANAPRRIIDMARAFIGTVWW